MEFVPLVPESPSVSAPDEILGRDNSGQDGPHGVRKPTIATINFAASRTASAKIKDYNKILKIFHTRQAPIAMLDMMCALNSKTRTARNNAHSFLREVIPTVILGSYSCKESQ